MGVVSVQARLTTEELLGALEQLVPAEVEKVSQRLLHLQARRRAANLSEREEELLGQVYRDHRPGFRERFDELNDRRRDFTPHSGGASGAAAAGGRI